MLTIFRMTGDEVAKARVRLGMTQRALAYEMGVTERAIRRWENETGAPPAASKALQLMLDQV